MAEDTEEQEQPSTADSSNPIEGTHGGSETGPTCDIDGTPLQAGDTVVFVAHHDPAYAYYVGKHAVIEWAQDVFPFSQICVELPDHPDLAPMSTFSNNVRKDG